MTRSESALVAVAGMLAAAALLSTAALLEAEQASDRWQIPATAATEANPVAVSDAVLAKGKQLFKSKCQRCHGPQGTGDGPDADPDAKPDDLTDGSRAARNPDGVLFYKMWNGRGKPKMPAFSTDLSREEVWTLVHYVKTLRK